VRGDHNRGDKAKGHGGGRRPEVPGRGGERQQDKASPGQLLWHRPVHDRRDSPGDQHPDCGQDIRCVRIRRLREGRGAPGKGHGRQRGRDRGRPVPGAAGGP